MSQQSTERNEDASTERNRGRRGLRALAAGLLGAAGLGALTSTASAAGQTPIVVVGDGRGRHDYAIEVSAGGSISKAQHAGANDTDHGRRVEGTIWHFNADSYVVSGDIESVTIDGSAAMHVRHGGFDGTGQLVVQSHAQGRHEYTIGSTGGDIDTLSVWNEPHDNDQHGDGSERWANPDLVEGVLHDANTDRWELRGQPPIQYVAVADGHISVSRS